MAEQNRHSRLPRQKEGLIASILGRVKMIKEPVDKTFLWTIIILLIYGTIMLYSASSARAYNDYGDSLFYIKRQIMWLAVGVAAMWFFSRLDYHFFVESTAGLLYVGCIVLLILVLLFGTEVKGAKRWIFGLQPSEFAKFVTVVLLSYKLSTPNGQKNIQDIKKSFLPNVFIVAVFAGLLLLQPHLSCTILIVFTTALLLLVAGTPIKIFLMAITIAIPVGIYLIFAESYRIQRVMNFWDPFKDLKGSGWQTAQSLYSIGSGGIFGVGLGNSRQKYQSLPEPHNDFVFSVLCEELGLVGAVILIALFIFLLVRGIKIALCAPDLFGTLLTVGFIGILTLQVLMNIAVVTASMPNTGVSLPFFSYGGTALVVTMAEMGIILNVSRQSKLPI